jgi:hypothetical protein
MVHFNYTFILISLQRNQGYYFDSKFLMQRNVEIKFESINRIIFLWLIQDRPKSPGSESVDSGIQSESVNSTATTTITSTTSTTTSDQNFLTAEEQLLLNQTREALSIYQR